MGAANKNNKPFLIYKDCDHKNSPAPNILVSAYFGPID